MPGITGLNSAARFDLSIKLCRFYLSGPFTEGEKKAALRWRFRLYAKPLTPKIS
jgi:hypothetical protein